MVRTSKALRVAVAALTAWCALAVAGAAPARAATGTGLEGIPAFDHIVVLPLENEDATTTFGPGSPATYLNALKDQWTFLPNYYGTSHVSLGNYVTMTSGLPANPATTSDCLAQNLFQCVASVTATSPATGNVHLGDQLDAAGLGWAGYLDGPKVDCFHADYSPAAPPPDPYQGNSQTGAGDYADRHNPWIYYSNVIGDDARCQAHVHPYTRLATDLANDTLPAFSFVTPDTCHDGHDAPCSSGAPGGLTSADQWLAHELPPLIAYLQAHRGLLVVNFDEGNPATTGQTPCPTCAGLGLGGRTGAVLIGAGVPQGATVTTGYDHASLLRTVEDSFGISEHLGLAGSPLAAPMTDAFTTTPAAVVPEAPHAALLPVAALLLAGLALAAVRRRTTPTR